MEIALVLIIGTALYLLPALIAEMKGHNQKLAILVLNILLGWTMIGWIVCLVWSLMNPPQSQIVYVQQPPPGMKP